MYIFLSLLALFSAQACTEYLRLAPPIVREFFLDEPEFVEIDGVTYYLIKKRSFKIEGTTLHINDPRFAASFIQWLSKEEDLAKVKKILHSKRIEEVRVSFSYRFAGALIRFSKDSKKYDVEVFHFDCDKNQIIKDHFKNLFPRDIFRPIFRSFLKRGKQKIQDLLGIEDLNTVIEFPQNDPNIEWDFYEALGLRFGITELNDLFWIDMHHDRSGKSKRTILLNFLRDLATRKEKLKLTSTNAPSFFESLKP